MTRGRGSRWAAVACLAFVAGWQAPARADEKIACANASDAGQKLRDEGKLLKARQQFLICARDACPGVIKRDCADWLAQAEANVPSVVLSAKDADGRDLAFARVTIDGVTSEEKLDGKAMALDPGPHSFRFEVPGEAPIDQPIVVREGEKNRSVAVSWSKVPHPIEGAPGPDWTERHLPAIVVGGAGVVVLGIGTALVLVAGGEYGTLEDTCGKTKTCTDDQISPVKTKAVLGDIGIGVGLVAIGAAVGLYVWEDRPPKAPVQIGSTTFDFVPAPGGGTAILGGRF